LISTDVPAIDVRAVTAGYGAAPVIEDLTFSIEQGCLAGLVGPNGSGKSTLIKVILGLLKPYSGTVMVLGEPSGRAAIGYAPQSERIDWAFPVTVLDVVLMGRYRHVGIARQPGHREREMALGVLERVGLVELRDRLIGELSGGQQRRVLIARAIVQDAPVMLLDEPLAGLDAGAQHDVLGILETLRDEHRTLLVSTHDLSCVAANFDHAILLDRKLIGFGRPGEVFTEELLSRTFRRHLLVIPSGGGKILA
jgi:ABC-type Mn2+/Zn2+ transport system ATPase subunit